MSIKTLINNQTPMLTLNQKMPGEQEQFKMVRAHRVYRQGEVPYWMKQKDDTPSEKQHKNAAEKDDIPSELRSQRRLATPKIVGLKAGKNSASHHKKHPEKPPKDRKTTKDDKNESDDDQFGEIDLANLVVANLPEHKRDADQPPEAKSRNRRAALKNSLLKNIQIKEDLRKLKEESRSAVKAPLAASSKSAVGKDGDELIAAERTGKDGALPGNASQAEEQEALSDDSYSSEAGEYDSVMLRRFEEEKPKFLHRKIRPDASALCAEENRLALNLMTETQEEATRNKELRRAESVQLVIDISRLEESHKQRERDAEVAQLPDDSDDIDEEAEFEKWKLRELKRMKAEADLRVKFEEEQAVVRMRREMDEQARERDNNVHGSKRYIKNQHKIRFLQKYYHKGAFYQDEAFIKNPIRERNFNMPVGEDSYTDRTLLPQVMQVKNFGTASRTKYTHLVDQDTTFGKQSTPARLISDDVAADPEKEALPIMGDFRNPVNPWIDFKSANVKRFRNIGGTGGFERPSRKKTR